MTCGFVVPSLRTDVTAPLRSFRPSALACVGLMSASAAAARTVTPSSLGPGLLQAPVFGSVPRHVGTLMPSRILMVSWSAVRRSDEKICASSGSYESAPSLVQLTAGGPMESVHSSAVPWADCQCLCRTSMRLMKRSSRWRGLPVTGLFAMANADTSGVMAL